MAELIQHLSAREKKEIQVPPPIPVVNGIHHLNYIIKCNTKIIQGKLYFLGCNSNQLP